MNKFSLSFNFSLHRQISRNRSSGFYGKCIFESLNVIFKQSSKVLIFASQLTKIIFSDCLPSCQHLMLKIFLNFIHLNWNITTSFHFWMSNNVGHLSRYEYFLYVSSVFNGFFLIRYWNVTNEVVLETRSPLALWFEIICSHEWLFFLFS